ncbi:MAG: hypothetical protein RLZZ179_1158 [Verrucomicrobiota bacterium]
MGSGDAAEGAEGVGEQGFSAPWGVGTVGGTGWCWFLGGWWIGRFRSGRRGGWPELRGEEASGVRWTFGWKSEGISPAGEDVEQSPGFFGVCGPGGVRGELIRGEARLGGGECGGEDPCSRGGWAAGRAHGLRWGGAVCRWRRILGRLARGVGLVPRDTLGVKPPESVADFAR